MSVPTPVRDSSTFAIEFASWNEPYTTNASVPADPEGAKYAIAFTPCTASSTSWFASPAASPSTPCRSTAELEPLDVDLTVAT